MKHSPLKFLAAACLALSITATGTTAATAAPTVPASVATSIQIATAKKAPAKVTINKKANATVKTKTSKYTLKPSYKAAKGVKVTSARITVTKSGKTVAKNAKSASLKPGTYKLTTTVKYNYKSGKKKVNKTATRTQTFTVTVKKPAVSSNLTGSNTRVAIEAKKIINMMRAKKGLPAFKSHTVLDKVSLTYVKSYNNDGKNPWTVEDDRAFTSLGGFAGAYVGYSVSDWFEMTADKNSEEAIYSKQYTHMGVSTHVGKGYTWISIDLGTPR